MQSLAELMNSAEGLSLLETRGVFVHQDAFKRRLRVPPESALAVMLGSNNTPLICSGQQVYIDYTQSVVSKIELLHDMKNAGDLFPFFLWVDTDRSGSDNLMSKFAWPPPSKKGPITILPPGAREVESRFAALDPSLLEKAMDKLETYLRQSRENRPEAKDKYHLLRSHLSSIDAETLSEFNLKWTDFLLNQVLGYSPHALVLSDLLDKGFFLEEVNRFVNRITDVVRVFNHARQTLVDSGIDPQVKPLDPNYLPLFYSCDLDDTRLRLFHLVEGEHHFAASRCKCGQVYRFYLGSESLSVHEITETGRWSPDVCFPIFLTNMVSGFVAGKSSALYLLVLNEVVREVLDNTPVPILVPESLGKNHGDPAKFDSLMYRYFMD